MPLRSVRALAAFGFCLTFPSLASAFENQWHLGAGAGVNTFTEEVEIGPALNLHGAYGLSDSFDLRVELTGAWHALDDDESVTLAGALGGATYKIDVIEWIPYFGLMVGYAGLLGDAAPEGSSGLYAAAPLGIDYAWTRQLGMGVQVRPGLLVGEETNGIFTALLRAEYRFGF